MVAPAAVRYRTSMLGRAAAVCLVAVVLPRLAAAVPPGTPQSIAALKLCNAVEDMADGERDAALERGLAMAEAAVAADERDARAHFALVCHLGKRMERAGFSLRQLVDLRRLRREMDVTLELAPGDADALLAKGALLLKLPRLLGGDTAEAEALLQQALVAEPDNTRVRCFLAEAQRERGVAVESPPGC